MQLKIRTAFLTEVSIKSIAFVHTPSQQDNPAISKSLENLNYLQRLEENDYS